MSIILNSIEFWLLFILALPLVIVEAVNITDSWGSSRVSLSSVKVSAPLESPDEIVIVEALKE